MSHDHEPSKPRSISFHPVLWRWLQEFACEEFNGNVSAAVAGLLLCHQGVKRALEAQGERYTYAAVVDIVTKRRSIDAAIEEITADRPNFSACTWLKRQIEKTRRAMAG